MGIYPYYDYYDYDYAAPATEVAGGVVGFLMVFVLLFYLIMFAYGIVNYVLYSLSLYKIAKRRGIHHPWVAWLPVGNVWVLGSISDQYQYVAKNRVRSRRKVLMGLNIGMFATMLPAYIGMFFAIFSEMSGTATGGAAIGAMVAFILLGCVAISILAIIMTVFMYIALYDLFSSCDPANAVLYLVLTIFFGVVLPFFLFACRNKDLGMPPRRPVQPVFTAMEPPVYAEQPAPAEPAYEPPVQKNEE